MRYFLLLGDTRNELQGNDVLCACFYLITSSFFATLMKAAMHLSRCSRS